MSDRKVNYVDIVADSRSVGRVVVVSEHVYARKFAVGNARDIRSKVVGDSFRILADKSAFVCAYRIEVTKKNDVPRVIRRVKILKMRSIISLVVP